MIRSLLASLTGTASDTAVLETAALAAQSFGAHADCLHVRFDVGNPSEWKQDSFAPLFVEQLKALERQIASAAENARKAFDDVRARTAIALAESPDKAGGKPSLAYCERTGSDFDDTIAEARVHDLTVVARDAHGAMMAADRAGAIMLGSGRPVLVPPRKTPRTLAGRVIVAWKDAPEAARAVAAAMPFLAKASEVHILAVGEQQGSERSVAQSAEKLAVQLAWHGVRARTKILGFSPRPAVEALLDESYALDADLLVMGGYGHSRLREFVFGGMTRAVLSACEAPVLLTH